MTIVAELLLGVLASMIVAWFNRQREFRADAGGAKLAGTHGMIAALERLRALYTPSQLPDQMAALGINGGISEGLKHLFMTHPPLDLRIATLRQRDYAAALHRLLALCGGSPSPAQSGRGKKGIILCQENRIYRYRLHCGGEWHRP